MKRSFVTHSLLSFFVGFGLCWVGASPLWAQSNSETKVWTNNADFSQNSGKKNVTWTDVPNQIQIIKNPPKSQQTPFIYIPHQSNHLTQLDTNTGKLNWRVSLPSLPGLTPRAGSPSRTTVARNGDVVFGMRFIMSGGRATGFASDVIHISRQGKLQHIYKGLGLGPRAITVELKGKVWVGFWKTNTMAKLDLDKKQVIKRLNNIACPYGAVADFKNNIWVVNNCKWDNSSTLTKMTTEGQILGRYPAPGAYGIATDVNGQVWASNWPGACLHRFTNDGRNLGCIKLGCQPRGLAVDGDSNVWVACSHNGRKEIKMVVKVSSTGQVLGKFSQVGKHTIGMAVDAKGAVWSVSYADSRAVKIDSKSGKIIGSYPSGGANPYTYSDMTGFAFQSLANPAQGYWRAIHSTKCLSKWQSIKWNGGTPPGTSITVRARTAAVKAGLVAAKWSPPLTNGGKPKVPDNPWIEIEVAMSTFDAQITPYVQDVAVTSVPDGEEICNGKDDNCNGKVDEGPDGKPITRPCSTRCGKGISPCVGGDWSICSARYPSPEVCDGEDNDCDGKVDDEAKCGGGSICSKGACARQCTSECPAGQRCEQGVCVGKTPCSQVTCKDGKVCKNGICVSPCAGIICPDNKPYVCVNGKCVQNDCYAKGCPAGQICRNAQCVANPCANRNCPAGQACKEGNCIDSCAGKNCAAGQTCRDGKCQGDPCVGVSCGPGQVCNFGKCQDDPCKGRECRQGQVCRRGQCVDNPCAGVSCPVGQVCKLPYGDCFGSTGDVDAGSPPIPDGFTNGGNSTVPGSNSGIPGSNSGTNQGDNTGTNTGENGTNTGENGTNTGENGTNTGQNGTNAGQNSVNAGANQGNNGATSGQSNNGRPTGACLCGPTTEVPASSGLLLLLFFVMTIGFRRRR